jgi:hypothetical protein
LLPLLLVAVVALALGTACQSPPSTVSADRAVQIARDYVVAGQPSDAHFQDLSTQPPQDLGSKWRVEVHAVVDFPQASGPVRVNLYFLIDVDKASGTPIIYTQG